MPSSPVGCLERDVHADWRPDSAVLDVHIDVLDEKASRPKVDKGRDAEEDRERVEQVKKGL